MSNLSFLFLVLFSLSALGGIGKNRSMSEVLGLHEERLQRLQAEPELNKVQKQLAKVIKKASKGRLNGSMLKYFTKRPQLLPLFYSVSKEAEYMSKKICQVKKEKRHKDDEVDAIRHILWSSYLALYLGSKKALEITSLNEDRGNNRQKSMLMDIYNNQFGVDNVQSLKRKRKLGLAQMKKQIILFAKESIKSGRVKVIKSKKSSCQRPSLYPNL